jgi:DNA-binding LytR/AlgR family response regulator
MIKKSEESQMTYVISRAAYRHLKLSSIQINLKMVKTNSLRILIIENDAEDLERLHKLIKKISPEKMIAGICGSVKESLLWLENNPIPDLIFSVVQLPDGLSFEIFKKLQYRVPVIFVCSFDKYGVEAFNANGVHYLLKPVNEEELRKALMRYDTYFSPHNFQIPRKRSAVQNVYQEKFIVPVANQRILIKAEEIAYFFTRNKIVYMVSFNGNKYATSFNLERLEKILNPKIFFRINRQFIINHSCIVTMAPASKSRLQLTLKPHTVAETFTSFGRTGKFRKWLLGKT